MSEQDATDSASALSEHAEELRRAFDRSFAEPVHTDTRETVDFITIRLAGAPHAIRMDEIVGLFAGIKTAPCPSPVAELLGIAGFRGTLTPVYDLAALLGHPPSSARAVVLAKDRALALAFDAFDEHLRVDPSAVASAAGGASRHIRQIARRAERAWPVIDIPSVVAALTARVAALTSHREH